MRSIQGVTPEAAQSPRTVVRGAGPHYTVPSTTFARNVFRSPSVPFESDCSGARRQSSGVTGPLAHEAAENDGTFAAVRAATTAATKMQRTRLAKRRHTKRLKMPAPLRVVQPLRRARQRRRQARPDSSPQPLPTTRTAAPPGGRSHSWAMGTPSVAAPSARRRRRQCHEPLGGNASLA